ncbi:Srb5p KNAG_0B01000 [Huiozyma naganishii CBS 8797]|uniref:Mediator of RNA polymerase II transcription subunit 18 n=1 Tax=Huiozyma naganishii (strain ATCC MYA-139 / BCRC 22969 / CBS 8797 / KCTC 17520 / NBRC 10181 / NCYC 3082 / Yp74L-3) TaxID=1071383 RepID=J7RUN3_HUIN7|nr:hypothetical protein KNAG_0B01000 [Kazachstania naganishii CBS 8797]CCK68547.1 hypothetical protein KNAG_0B01000 [Kazachstania naganishii CBS 8797]
MVQQLSLFGVIDDESYDLFVSTMTMSYGSSPIIFANLDTMWKPDPAFEIGETNSKNQLVEKNRIKMSQVLPLDLLSKDSTGEKTVDSTLLKELQTDELPIPLKIVQHMINNNSSDETDPTKSTGNSGTGFGTWTMSISDIPAAGSNRKVCMQSITESVLIDSIGPNASTQSFMKQLCYVLDYLYVSIGIRFHLKHGLVVELQKVWDMNSGKQITKGGFLIKAYTNIKRATDIDRLNYSEQILLNLQKELQGYLDLVMADRKSMNSKMGLDNESL